jgi:hypothetical protein
MALSENQGGDMKECPLKVDEDSCEQCHWNFGRDQCAPFSMATDLSVISEEIVRIRVLLEKIANHE